MKAKDSGVNVRGPQRQNPSGKAIIGPVSIGLGSTPSAKGRAWTSAGPDQRPHRVGKIHHSIHARIVTRPLRPVAAVRIAGLGERYPIGAGQGAHRLVVAGHLIAHKCCRDIEDVGDLRRALHPSIVPRGDSARRRNDRDTPVPARTTSSARSRAGSVSELSANTSCFSSSSD